MIKQSSGKLPRWEHFPHDADIGVRGVGATKPDALAQVALAMTAAVTDPSHIEPRDRVDIQFRHGDDSLLLYDWLNALVFEMAVRSMLFSRFDIVLEADRLTATVWGESVDPDRHQPAAEIKGATFTGLRLEPDADGHWIAECVVDV